MNEIGPPTMVLSGCILGHPINQAWATGVLLTIPHELGAYASSSGILMTLRPISTLTNMRREMLLLAACDGSLSALRYEGGGLMDMLATLK